MLKDSLAFSGFFVGDMEAAKVFYKTKLGLQVTEEMQGLLNLHFANGSKVLIYLKPNYQAATFKILNFIVNDIEQTVDDLNKLGVQFEKYDYLKLKQTKKEFAGANL